MKKYILVSILALGLGATMSSCDDYLDVNQNPNSPEESALNVNAFFPGAELAFANSYGDYLRITSGYFAQYYSQMFGTSNYLDYSQFSQSSARCSSTYTNLCVRCLKNMDNVIKLAEENEDWAANLAAKIIKCATYQIFVDCWGDVPYSEGMDINIPIPNFDNGQDVYAGILAELDEAKAKAEAAMTSAGGDLPMCTNFLLDGENLSAWVQLANALKLRILMRESNVVNVQSELAALIAEDNFPTEDIAWQGCWSNESGKANPFYQEEFATYFGSTQKNLALNIALLKTFEESMDSRLEAFFDKNSNGAYWGAVSGTNFSTSATYKSAYFCRPTAHYDDPVYFITVAETEFFLAEYEARYGSMAEAQAHYEAAVKASFETAGLDADDAESVLEAYPWDSANYKRCIGIQKWVAMSGVNPFEGYCELRRLKYPEFSNKVTGDILYSVVSDTYSTDDLEPGTLYTPINVFSQVGNNQLLQRWPYPTSMQSTNGNTPTFAGYTEPIFWAK